MSYSVEYSTIYVKTHNRPDFLLWALMCDLIH